MKYIKRYESSNNSDISDEIKEILGNLTDDGYDIQITPESDKVAIEIKKPKWFNLKKDRGHFGYVFYEYSEISSELVRLHYMIEDRWNIFETKIESFGGMAGTKSTIRSWIDNQSNYIAYIEDRYHRGSTEINYIKLIYEKK